VVFVFLFCIYFAGISNINFKLSRIYELRPLFHQNVLGGIMGYFFNWVVKSLNIFLILFALHKKKIITSIALSFCQVVFFGISTHKAVFFYPFLAALFYFISLKKIHPFSIPLIFTATTSISLISHTILSKSTLAILFVFRIFYLTGYNHYCYYDFFEKNHFTFFSNSFLRFFLEYGYSKKIPEIIGESRWEQGVDAFANTGIFATGYMQLGFYGLLLYTFVIAISFRIIDSLLSQNKFRNIFLGVFTISVWSFSSADIGSIFLTHGLLISLLLTYLCSSYRKQTFNPPRL
jgi:hypothetical protein